MHSLQIHTYSFRLSSLASKLETTPILDPIDYDFSNYAAEMLQVDQESFREGEFGLVISFLPIAFDIHQYQLLINDRDVGLWSQAVPDCSNFNRRVSMTYRINEYYSIGGTNDVSVGTKVNMCLRGIWKDSSLSLTNGTWDALTTQDSIVRPSPEVCIDYTMKFQSRVTFLVRNANNTEGIDGAVVTFTVDDSIIFPHTQVFKGVADKVGRVGFDIVLDRDLPVGTTRNVPIYIQSVTLPKNDEIEFALCASISSLGNLCESMHALESVKALPVYIDHLNSNPQSILIVEMVNGKDDKFIEPVDKTDEPTEPVDSSKTTSESSKCSSTTAFVSICIIATTMVLLSYSM